jgi:hypothetical protein
MRNWDEAIRKQLAPLHLGSKRELQITEELKQYAEDRYHDLIAAGASCSTNSPLQIF